jgi:hypothetical protein
MLATSAALAAMLTGFGGATADAAVRVPCDPDALAQAMTAAAAGGALSLAAECDYVLTAGLPAVTGTLTITGNAATLKRSQAPGTPQFTILRVTGGNLTVAHLSFSNGDAGRSGDGGAISVAPEGQLTVTGGTFSRNAAGDGGAIYSNADPDAPVITGAKFTGNHAVAGAGGAIFSDSPAGALGCTGCTFTGNSAADDGGAVFEFGLGGGVTGSQVRGNTAGVDGGGLWLSEDGEENLSGDTIQGNAAGGNGGGAYSAEGGNGGNGAYARGTVIAGNTAGGDGGGLWEGGFTRSSLVGTVIRGNRAQDGGGIWGDPGSSVIATGTVITGNRAAGNGGGAAGGAGQFGIFSLAGGQVAGNRAGGNGGGILAQGETDLTGTPVTGNNAAAGGGIYVSGAFATVALHSSAVTGNNPDNCEPAGIVTGC